MACSNNSNNKNDTGFELPRLTRSLRAFTQLEPPERNVKHHDGTQYLQRAKQYQKEEKQRECNWDQIKGLVSREGLDLQGLDNIYQFAKRLSKDEKKEVVEDTATFLFLTFMHEPMALQKHVHLIRRSYGDVSYNLVQSIHAAVQAVSVCLSEDALTQLTKKQQKSKPMFGSEIEFVPRWAISWKHDIETLSKLKDMSNDGSQFLDKFTVKYEGSIAQDEEVKSINAKRLGFGRGWLDKEVRKYFSRDGFSVDEMVGSIVSQLQQDISNDALQNILFDMLGFDRFELIETLLQHRADIVHSLEQPIAPSRPVSTESKKPTIATQVVVELEHEKLLRKMARKEEKRFQRAAGKLPADEDSEEEDFNPVELRTKRLAALNKTPVMPVFVGKKKTPETYPHVYDSNSQVKQTAGFIAGVKMMLSANIQRVDSKLCEEVHIPLTEQPPLNVGKHLVNITALNEVGRTAFEGIQQLNRIQSVVFSAAYHTNENLLICAPTGAGKTNVALLTVAHQIEQHVENMVIKKDSFKIVYVAPMKALAAEMTRSFGSRLAPLGIVVKELTGDMQLTKAEILQTQMLITTPEKWDVVTRKGTGDLALTKLVKLLIIDEVHLLHGDRGPVVEALVARTLRQVETSQSMIRIVGLSATLPNYLDVARFLRVNPHVGLFFFDSRFRPVPLSPTFIGVKATKPMQQMSDMDQVCFDKVLEQVKRGHQVMVFVHARNATIRTANVLKELASQKNELAAFEPEDQSKFSLAKKSASRLKNKQVAELFQFGFSCHHAGMLRADRTIVEKYFADGQVKVLVCTSTLAWGVNLPAHAVVIRGTDIYDAKHGSFVDLGILDVLQIFGRAGRPQFDKSGHGIIITSHEKLSHYLSLLTDQFPIESNFINFLADNLNAEVTLGTISNVDEAVEWLSYTYLFVRMRMNPQVYGINYTDVQDDPQLLVKRREVICACAKALDKARMVRYNERTGDLSVTDLGRTASHFYIKYDTVEVFNEMFRPFMTDCDVFNMIAHAQEFQQLKVRDDELDELDGLMRDNCEVQVMGGSENLHGKVNILLQTFLSRGRLESFSLISDQSYIIQNAVRIARALFDIALRKNNAIMSARFLLISKMLELQMWEEQTPLRQFGILGGDILSRIEEKNLTLERLREMEAREIGDILRNPRMGPIVQRCAGELPTLSMTATLQPITRTVLRIRLEVAANFTWNDRVHGKSTEPFWIWIEDPNNNFIYHSEYFLITKRQVVKREVQELVMTIPLTEPLPPQYYVKAVSDRWVGSDITEALSFQHLILPETHPPHTDLLPLQPLPVTALGDPKLEKLYRFTHFNPIQTQIFHCLYHTNTNVLLGAPTGSGKTIVAEIAMFRVFREYPKSKVVYIAPLKALVRERMEDWKVRLERTLGRRVVELTGDVSPDVRAITAADVIVTTPEKWDGISRSWQTRNYVKDVALIVIDEIHLLGEDRGPVLEVIVSRTNFISSHTARTLRIIGLSTALANAKDLANWLGIGAMGLYNFRPSVRPVPLEVHIAGFPGKHYCPRMATMNRPAFQAIRQHSPAQPALIFVSSRRQTRLTALDLIAYLAGEDDPKQWLHMSENEMDQIVASTKDQNLRLTLAFGIGMHHAGLTERDRRTVEELFVNQKIQVLIATATLAWGVNFPAHLVVVKGTEYYDGKLKRYVDMPITDVLQMMGRAGRPQYDEQGVAVVLVHDIKKNFYKKFLYEPFPVESSLLDVLPDHLNAEVVSGTIQTKQDALDYLTWTYFFRRLIKNPTYYQLEDVGVENVNVYLSALIEKSFATLDDAYCINVLKDGRSVETTSMGRIASFYYLAHQTMRHFRHRLEPGLNLEQLLQVLCDVHEYEQLPVRHNEDILNGELAKTCPLAVNHLALDSPHTKAQLLFQAHFSRLHLPCADYLTDLKSVLDQAIRILQAMIDVSAEQGWLATTLRTEQLMQMVVQAAWVNASPLLTLPHILPFHITLFNKAKLTSLPGLMAACSTNYQRLAGILRSELAENDIDEVLTTLKQLPVITMALSLRGGQDSAERDIPCRPSRSEWLQVEPGQEYLLVVRLQRVNRTKDGLRAHTPRFPRGKDEGWFLTLGCIEDQELHALKRVSGVHSQSTQTLSFLTPTNPGRTVLTLYLMSDCYLGLDQQYSFNLQVGPDTRPHP